MNVAVVPMWWRDTAPAPRPGTSELTGTGAWEPLGGRPAARKPAGSAQGPIRGCGGTE